jgi:hypothetical protein
MAASFVQITKGNTLVSSSSFSQSFGSGITAGSIIAVAGLFGGGDRTSATISNDKGDTFTDSGGGFVVNTAVGPNTHSFCGAFLAPTTGAITVTITPTGGSTNANLLELVLWEISGLTNAVIDKQNHTNSTGLAIDSGSTGTLSSSTEAGIAYAADSNAVAGSAGSGWTFGQGSTTTGNNGDGIFSGTTLDAGEHRVISATTAINGTFTSTLSGDSWTAWVMTMMSGAAATVSQFYQPFSIPVLRIPDRNFGGLFFQEVVAAQPFLYTAGVTEVPYIRNLLYSSRSDQPPRLIIDTTPDRYWRPLSEPNRRPPQQYPAFFSQPSPISGEIIRVDKWFQEYAIPVPLKRLADAPSFFFNPLPITTDLKFAWYRQLSEPTRPIPGAWRPAFSYDPFPFTVEKFLSWFQPLSSPTRPIPGAWQPYYAFDPYVVPTGEIVTLDKWFKALSEPTRLIPGRPDHFAFDPFPFPVDLRFGWFRQLSEPTRPIPGRPDRFAFDPFPFQVDLRFDWYRALSEPVLRKPGAWYPEPSLYPFPLTATELVTLDKWFRQLDIPRRNLLLRIAGIGEVLPPFPIVNPPVTPTTPSGLSTGVPEPDEWQLPRNIFKHQSDAYKLLRIHQAAVALGLAGANKRWHPTPQS